jgi:uncharacterized protein YndB with AHSA1/START domain
VHDFDAREGGAFRISLTYDEPTATGKTTAHTDTYYGQFAKLVTNEQLVEMVEFETADPAMQGEMTITISLTDTDGGTDVFAVHDTLPPGLSPVDDETCWAGGTRKARGLCRRAEQSTAGNIHACHSPIGQALPFSNIAVFNSLGPSSVIVSIAFPALGGNIALKNKIVYINKGEITGKI